MDAKSSPRRFFLRFISPYSLFQSSTFLSSVPFSDTLFLIFVSACSKSFCCTSRSRKPSGRSPPLSRTLACSCDILTTASLHNSFKSLPVKPSSFSASLVKLTSLLTRFWFRVTSRISRRVSRSGKSTMMRLGNLLSTASSRSKGRLVEPMTMTRDEPASPSPLVPLLSPSHSLMSVVLTEVRVECEESSLDSLDDRIESTSSMKTTHGARRRASVKTALAFFSLSPNHLFSIDEASTAKKVAPPSVATALASMVFPVPGGPNSRTPFTASLAIPSE
mmetsp:Transcript_20159/g.37610  ORF Transcript_20159/g.37610 Transcript_20159/m.37610 type:complete len:277 (+) Transcript_20159:69-899(+)